MTLVEKLQAATSEEDVKAAYIKALGLKDVQYAKYVFLLSPSTANTMRQK